MDVIAGTRKNSAIKHVMGVDLGQSMDPTALSVLEHSHSFREWERGGRDQHEDVFAVRHLARLPLGLSYPAVVQEVAMLLARPPLVGNCELIIDATGVGRPVADLFDVAGLNPVRVTITAGDAQTWIDGGWHVSKTTLISTLDARLHTGELVFAKELTEAGTMQEELRDFRRHVTASGRYQYEARSTKHDDLVLSVAIALWSCTGRPKQTPPRFGHYSRSHGIVLNRNQPGQ